jgi:hypothetical protein
MAVRAASALIAAVMATLSTPAAAQVYSCRGYPSPAVVVQVKIRVEALRRIEREAADRLLGLDTRPYDWLLAQARAGEAALADPVLLAAEDDLKRCRNYIRPLRRGCAVAATALARLIEDLVAGDANRDARQAYAQTMPNCEQAVKLTPLSTTLRTTE